jgi:IclR family acetate operon transcriptional repressor
MTMAAEPASESLLGVRSVERALDLLGVLGEAAADLTLSDAARLVNHHPATAHRLLRTMVAAGFVAQDATTRRYRLGERFIQLAHAGHSRQALPGLAGPFLERLAAETGETAGLLQLVQDQTVVLARVLSAAALRVHAPVGARGPLHATAIGQVLLAYAPLELRERILASPLTVFTTRTPIQRTALRRRCNEVRGQGYAVSVDEYLEGVTTIAAPVHAQTGAVIAGISLSGPTSRITVERIETSAAAVCAAAFDLSHALGYREPAMADK